MPLAPKVQLQEPDGKVPGAPQILDESYPTPLLQPTGSCQMQPDVRTGAELSRFDHIDTEIDGLGDVNVVLVACK